MKKKEHRDRKGTREEEAEEAGRREPRRREIREAGAGQHETRERSRSTSDHTKVFGDFSKSSSCRKCLIVYKRSSIYKYTYLALSVS